MPVDPPASPQQQTVVFLVAIVAVGALIGFFVWLWLQSLKERTAAERQAKQRMEELKRAMVTSPADKAMHGELLDIAKRFPHLSQEVYNASLFVVEHSRGETATRLFALSAGRLLASFQRINRAPTIYDEQAIQNDISMRTPKG